MSDWRTRATEVTDPVERSRTAVLIQNRNLGEVNKYQTIPGSQPQLPVGQEQPMQEQPTIPTASVSDWRSRAVEVQQEKTFSQKVSDNYQKRIDQMQKSADAYVAGQQTMPETVVQQAAAYASNLPDLLTTTAGVVIPQKVKDVAGNVLSGTLNVAGKLPSISGRTLGQDVPKELSTIEKNNPRLVRNVQAVGELANLVPTAKLLNSVGTGIQNIGKTELAQKYIKGEGTTSGIVAQKATEKQTLASAQSDMGALADKAYAQARELGATFKPNQVGNKFEAKIQALRPVPMANGKLTTEDSDLLKHLDELTGNGGKSMTLDDVQRLDEALTQKINKFVDPRTGQLDANGRKLNILQRDLRDIVYSTDAAGNNALINGRTFYRAKAMLSDINAVAERASMSQNVGRALQAGYKSLYLDKDRIRGWPKEALDLLKKAATPGVSDEVLDTIGSRLPALIGFGSGNVATGAASALTGVASRGVKESIIAGRGAKVQQAIVKDAMAKQLPVTPPTPDVPKLLAAPGKLSPLNRSASEMPMSAEQIAISKALISKEAPTPGISGVPITPAATPEQVGRLLSQPSKMSPIRLPDKSSPSKIETTVYHASKDNSILDQNYKGVTFFTDNKSIAEHHITSSPEYQFIKEHWQGPIAQKAKITINNPAPENVVVEEAKKIYKGKLDSEIPAVLLDENYYSEAPKLVKKLKSMGYDGSVLTDYKGTEPFKSYVTFDSKQIKLEK